MVLGRTINFSGVWLMSNRSFSNDFSDDKTTHGSNSTFFGELNEYRTKSGEFWMRGDYKM